ncbi:hypothetical protein CAPTEDRAFT_201941 [Capitella teleta]|uniref:Uncharacterized protein n=1 Tax=Capitella teleta TaxID=283909 RepID=R7TD08_CAPTE|nr:hypothetical protein CAPTEDRAFT_201941 [Capitella teleta]|eukprot:ELT91362.1 hypothetical protein CAPTEDRAFT_201941 [Capitella teleta]
MQGLHQQSRCRVGNLPSFFTAAPIPDGVSATIIQLARDRRIGRKNSADEERRRITGGDGSVMKPQRGRGSTPIAGYGQQQVESEPLLLLLHRAQAASPSSFGDVQTPSNARKMSNEHTAGSFPLCRTHSYPSHLAMSLFQNMRPAACTSASAIARNVHGALPRSCQRGYTEKRLPEEMGSPRSVIHPGRGGLRQGKKGKPLYQARHPSIYIGHFLQLREASDTLPRCTGQQGDFINGATPNEQPLNCKAMKYHSYYVTTWFFNHIDRFMTVQIPMDMLLLRSRVGRRQMPTVFGDNIDHSGKEDRKMRDWEGKVQMKSCRRDCSVGRKYKRTVGVKQTKNSLKTKKAKELFDERVESILDQFCEERVFVPRHSAENVRVFECACVSHYAGLKKGSNSWSRGDYRQKPLYDIVVSMSFPAIIQEMIFVRGGAHVAPRDIILTFTLPRTD